MLVNVFSKVLLVSIMAAVIIVLILFMKAAFKEKLSARWHYSIWFLLVIRLIIPYTPDFSENLDGFVLRNQGDIRVQTEEYAAGSTDMKADSANNEVEQASEYNAGYNLTITDEKDAIKNSENEKNSNSRIKQAIMEIASKIWLVGVALLLLYILIINCLMSCRIRMTSVTAGSNDIRDILEYCKKLLNVRRDIPVVYQNHIKTPAISGVFKTKMLIPAGILDQLSADEIRYVILHELCHFKRRDMMVGMLQILLSVINWFNPFVWYAFNKMREDREPVCDEMVLSYINPDERRNYAETLIKILKCFSENRWVCSMANMSQGSVENMEWRLKLINILKKRSVIPGVVIALVTITLGVAGIFIINSHLSFIKPVDSVSAGPADTNQAAAPVSAVDEEIPTRGKILDRNGKVLVVSIPADIIALNPREIKASGHDAGAIAENLADFLALEKEEVLEKVTASSAYEIIKRKVDKETGNKIREWVRNSNIKGIMVDEDSKRYYPNNNLAAHVIGFTGIDDGGVAGIELSMDQNLKLKGTNTVVNGKKALEGGMNIVLTIDAGIQGIVENALDEAIKEYKTKGGAAAIVMDPKNGEILAMASRPDFNPNMPYSPPPGVDADTWKGNTQENAKKFFDTVWRNKSLSDTFEPGSTFKSITAAAGLEEGVVKPDTITDDLPIKVPGGPNPIYCWRRGSEHGTETFREGVYNSCNPVFVKVAQSLGVEKFYTYMRDFGFYDKTGLELPGEAKSIIHPKPVEIDMAVASFGERFHITPIQLAAAYGAVANGGKLMKPQIIRQIAGTDNSSVKIFEPQVIRSVISPETADSMRAILEGVVSKGTASNAYVEGYKIAGCVGTSETTTKNKYMASFAGFAPADNPQITCIIILDEPTTPSHLGGMTAAPVAGKVMREVLDYLSKN